MAYLSLKLYHIFPGYTHMEVLRVKSFVPISRSQAWSLFANAPVLVKMGIALITTLISLMTFKACNEIMVNGEILLSQKPSISVDHEKAKASLSSRERLG